MCTKKFLRILTVGIAYAVSLAACQDSLGPDGQDGKENIQSSIVVGIDNTRTSVDASGKVVWSEGDCISLTCSGVTAIYTIDPDDAGKSVAKFVTSGTIAFTKGAQVEAYYPASICESGLEWPSEQTYAEGAACPMYVSATVEVGGEAPEMTFKNLGSILRLNISSSQAATIKKIKIESADPLAGGFDVSDDKAVITGGQKSIVLDCGEGEEVGSTPKAFNIAVPANAGSDPYKDFNVFIETTDGTFAETAIADLPKALQRNTVYDVAVKVPFFYLGFANCFVVKPNTTYVMRADLAGNLSSRNTEYVLENPSYAKLVYETQNSSRAPESNRIIAAGMTYSNGFITFTTGNEGNAMIAVYDASGTALWSWHIWVRKTTPVDYTNDGVTYMDRELGGLSANGQGLAYQYSRKDPLMDVVGSTGKRMMWTADGVKTNENQTVVLNTSDYTTDFMGRNSAFDFAVKHPGLDLVKGNITGSSWYNNTDRLETYFWSKDKFGIDAVEDLMDPCPYGYHVPTISELQAILSGSTGNALKGGGYVPSKSGLLMFTGAWSEQWTGMAYWTCISMTATSYDIANGQTYYISDGVIKAQNFSGGSKQRVRCVRN